MTRSAFGRSPPPRSSASTSSVDELLVILSEYVSPINARSLLARSTNAQGNALPALDPQTLSAVLARVESGAVLFTRPDRHSELRTKLAAFSRRHGPAQQKSELIEVRAEADIVVARTRARALCSNMGARSVAAHKVATVVSELARNIVSYTPGGTIELAPHEAESAITITARDEGTGIPNLDAILNGRYQSRTGLGLGISGSRKLADSFDIRTGPTGTTVTLKISL